MLVEVAPDLVGLFVPGASLVGAVGKAIANKTGWTERLETLAHQTPVAASAMLTDQARIYEQYWAFLTKLSEEAPLLLFIDDLHWADEASIGLLFHIGRQLAESRILVVGAFRPSEVALGRASTRHPLEPVLNELTRYYGDILLDLDVLSEDESRSFVGDFLTAEYRCLSGEFGESLYTRTGGHPLFTVELLRSMEERGAIVQGADGCWSEGAALDWNSLPVRIEGVVAERIERLDPSEHRLLEAASVQGEQFAAEIIAHLTSTPERDAIRVLSGDLTKRHRLISAVGIRQVGANRLSIYRFQHTIFQQYLYENIGQAERSYLHQDVALALEVAYAHDTHEVAAQLARHFEEAGFNDRAANYRLEASEHAGAAPRLR